MLSAEETILRLAVAAVFTICRRRWHRKPTTEKGILKGWANRPVIWLAGKGAPGSHKAGATVTSKVSLSR